MLDNFIILSLVLSYIAIFSTATRTHPHVFISVKFENQNVGYASDDNKKNIINKTLKKMFVYSNYAGKF